MTQLPDLYYVAFKMLGALSFVVLTLYLFLRFFRSVLHKDIQNAGSKLVHVIENHYLGSKKSITVFKIPDGMLIVGISGDRMELLAHIKEDECSRSLTSNAIDDRRNNNSFTDTFFKLLPIGKKSGETHDNS